MHVDLYKERTPIMVLVHGKEMTQAYEKAFEEAAELLRMVKLNLECKKVIEHEQKRGAYATICTTTMELEKQLNTWATSVNGSLQEMKKEIRMELEEMWRTIAS